MTSMRVTTSMIPTMSKKIPERTILVVGIMPGPRSLFALTPQNTFPARK